MLVAFPEDRSVLNDVAYLNLLLNEDIEKSSQAAVELVRSGPNRVLTPG